LKGFARYGGGVTFLPCLPIRRELDRQVLVSIPIVENTFQQSTHDVCTLAGRRLPLAVEAFVEQLKVEALTFPTDRSD
jgi:DNA-binding transcriptional LysR family regulator